MLSRKGIIIILGLEFDHTVAIPDHGPDGVILSRDMQRDMQRVGCQPDQEPLFLDANLSRRRDQPRDDEGPARLTKPADSACKRPQEHTGQHIELRCP